MQLNLEHRVYIMDVTWKGSPNIETICLPEMFVLKSPPKPTQNLSSSSQSKEGTNVKQTGEINNQMPMGKMEEKMDEKVRKMLTQGGTDWNKLMLVQKE